MGAYELLREYLGWEVGYMNAVIFINVFCVFDTLDNISAKECERLRVHYLDLTFMRLLFNYGVASLLVRVYE